MTLVVGVDTASNRWHAIVKRDGNWLAKAEEVRPSDSKKKNFEPPDVRRKLMADAFQGFLNTVELHRYPGEQIHVFCEESLALQNGKTTRLLALAAGAIWDRHCSFNLFWHWVDVASWQKMAGIGGRMKSKERKARVREWVLELGMGALSGLRADDLVGYDDVFDEDHYDAGGLALYGEWYLSEIEA